MELILNTQTRKLTVIIVYKTGQKFYGVPIYTVITINKEKQNVIRFGTKEQMLSMVKEYKKYIDKKVYNDFIEENS